MEEKRKSARVQKPLIIQYCLESDKAKNIWCIASLRDISEGGVSFCADKNSLAGEILILRIKFPFNPLQWVELKGINLSSRELLAGMYVIHLKFLDLEEREKMAIREYVKWALEKEGGRRI